MGLITNDRSSLFGGVNQQSAEHRQDNQVEEMINAVPTIDRGLLKRNPTVKKDLTHAIDYSSEIWNYEYDRGTSGDSEEQYSVVITQDKGLEIININSGKVYTQLNGGINFSASALNYLYPFVSGNGYAATTVKDTTFLVNKSVLPRLNPSVYDPEDDILPINNHYVDIPYDASPNPIIVGGGNTGMDGYLSKAAPMNALVAFEAQDCAQGAPTGLNVNLADYEGATIEITVDGLKVIHVVRSAWQRTINKDGEGYRYILYPETFAYAMSQITSGLAATLESTGLYTVDVSNDKIRIQKNAEDEAIAVTVVITFPPTKSYYTSGIDYDHCIGTYNSSRLMNPIQSDYFGTLVAGTDTTYVTVPNNSYLATGFIWVKRAVTTDSYNYLATVKFEGTAAIKFAAQTGVSTDVAATNLATEISTHANLTAVAVGSIVKITTNDDATIEYVSISDSFGNQASGSFAHTVATMNDLPSNMEFEATIIKVSGTENGVFQTYWVKYDGSVWQETKDPEALSTLDDTTMPHVLTREADDTFTIAEYDQWATRKVGDDVTNQYPSFASNGKVAPSPIKDIFFFKNRLGFITSTTVAMSEVGEYGNFWRTTVFAVLDSDPIDTSVDSSKAIELEYASYLEDSLMLFADKAQFKLAGGSILSPKSVQISQTSAYETDRGVRPIFLNDKIFFIVKRGDSSALYEYFVSSNSEKSESVDVTAHVQTYLPNGITKLSGSPVNSMLFAFSNGTPDTVYVYKYYDIAGERKQSSWFKWSFNGSIFNAFSFGKYLNLLIERKQSTAVEDWVIATGIWDNFKLWDNSLPWVMSPDSLSLTEQFEQMAITPQEFTNSFIDNDIQEEDTSNINGYVIDTTIASGDVLSRQDARVILFNESVEVVVSHLITLGSLTINVYHGSEVSSAVANIGDTSTTIVVAKSLTDSITKIEMIPEYNVPVNIRLAGVEIIGDLSGDNLLYNDGVYGIFVDDVPMPTDPAQNIGNWVKQFGTKTIGSIIPVTISLGEWVMSSGGTKNNRGHLHFKTAQIISEEGSDFSLIAEDVRRNTLRTIKSKYTVGRKPMIYGDAVDMRVHIVNSSDKGFKINSVSFEGNYNSRNKKV